MTANHRASKRSFGKGRKRRIEHANERLLGSLLFISFFAVHFLFHFCKGTDGTRAQSDALSVYFLGLEVYLECSPGGDIRMTPRIAGCGASTGHGASPAHIIDSLGKV